MKKSLILSVFVLSICALFSLTFYVESSAENVSKDKPVYNFKMKDIDGKNVKLKKYKGDVLLIVNTASKCGYTPQYQGLQAIYDKYKAQGFYVLGFPANNFGGQEPGSNEEIKEFCTLKYKVSFPMFAKISVKGDDQHPLYQYLTSEKTDPKFAGEITWNFNKFLVNEKGEIIARFSSKETPESKEVTTAIENALDKMSKK